MTHKTIPLRRTGLLWWAWLALLFCAAGAAQADCLNSKRLLGVNVSGAEFGQRHLPGVLFKDYVYPNRGDLTYLSAKGVNVVRLPFLWERIQHQLSGPLDANELVQMKSTVALAQSLGMCVILDLHNFGRYYNQAIGTADVPDLAFSDVWLRLAEAFPDAHAVALGLMNEPAAIPVADWQRLAQSTLLALRDAGAEHLILVPSGRWSGAHEWNKTYDGTSAATGFHSFVDPLKRYAIELHQYADGNFSGTGKECISAERLKAILAPVTLWAKQEKVRFFMGEFGVPNTPSCLAALSDMFSAMQDSSAWLGWTYWSTGPWWGNYPMSAQPKEGVDAPQFVVLQRFLDY